MTPPVAGAVFVPFFFFSSVLFLPCPQGGSEQRLGQRQSKKKHRARCAWLTAITVFTYTKTRHSFEKKLNYSQVQLAFLDRVRRPWGGRGLLGALWHGRDVPPKGGNALGTWRGRGGGGGNAHGRREKERRGGKRDAARGTRGIYISPPRKCSRPENVTTTAPKTLPILLHTS